MSIIIFITIIILLFLLGLGISVILNVDDILELWSLSWLLGMGFGTLFWFISYQLLHLSFTLTSLFTILIISNILVFSYAISTKNKVIFKLLNVNIWKKIIPSVSQNLRKNHALLYSVCIILFIFGFIFLQDIFWPVTDWDALALYDFRAKVIISTGTLEQGKELGYFFQYPPFTTLLHTITYLSGLQVAKIWYAIIYQATIINFFVLLKKESSTTVSILGTLFLAVSPQIYAHAFMAYTNLSYTIYTGLGFIYLWLWFNSSQRNYSILGGILIGLGTWVRISEPFYYIGLILVILTFVKSLLQLKTDRKFLFLDTIVTSSFVLFIRYPWDRLIFTLFSTNVNTPLATISLVNNWNIQLIISRFFEVSSYLITYSLPTYSLYLFIACLLLLNDLYNKRWGVVIKYLTILLLLGTIFVGTLITSLWLESWNRIGDSVARMSMVLIPLVIYTIFTSPSWKYYRKSK